MHKTSQNEVLFVFHNLKSFNVKVNTDERNKILKFYTYGVRSNPTLCMR